MRKIATIFLLIVAFGMVFSGVVSAQEVTTTVIDENGNPATTVCNGDTVTIDVVANNTDDITLEDPFVNITALKNSSLVVNPTTAIMYYNGIPYTNDPNDPFFWWEPDWGWVWWIGWAVDDNAMYPGETAILDVTALVKETGAIKVTSDFYAWPEQVEDPILLDSDSYTFQSVPCRHCHPHGATVPMQATGAPLAVAALGLLSIIGGAVYGKLR
ncbi:MAG: hypothetical protein LLF83_01485 [Methanobacterium sp.]|nr:hypothetical protein [Methanobacterium sp.]